MTTPQEHVHQKDVIRDIMGHTVIRHVGTDAAMDVNDKTPHVWAVWLVTMETSVIQHAQDIALRTGVTKAAVEYAQLDVKTVTMVIAVIRPAQTTAWTKNAKRMEENVCRVFPGSKATCVKQVSETLRDV